MNAGLAWTSCAWRRPYFQDCVFVAFQKFVEQYREGAFVVLQLLSIMSGFSRPYVERERIGLGEAASFEYADYSHFHMLYIPSLVHHEPLELLLVLRKLSELMPRLNYADDCAKYFSMGYEVNPYHVETFDSTRYENKLPGRYHHSGIYYF